MKAAVLHETGGIPRYEDFPDPVARQGEVIIDVKAVAIENVDKQIAAGTHYASGNFLAELPAIPAFDGVGTLPDGTLVGFGNPRGPYGALAEKTVVPAGAYAPIPEGIDPAVATVLATAVTDTVINTAVPDGALAQAFADARGEGYDVVVDYLWGRPTEILLRTLTPTSFAFPKPTRLIQIGEAAGRELTVAAESLRTSGIEIYGASRGLNAETMGAVYGQIVEWAQTGALTFEVEKVCLSDIETAWQRTALRGRRLVAIP